MRLWDLIKNKLAGVKITIFKWRFAWTGGKKVEKAYSHEGGVDEIEDDEPKQDEIMKSIKTRCPQCGGEADFAVRCANDPPGGQCLDDNGNALVTIGHPITEDSLIKRVEELEKKIAEIRRNQCVV